MELTILILLLPLLSFLTLGIGGKWMTHRTAGLIGTVVLGTVAVLSYFTAFQYFTAPRLADGTFATLMPYNMKWLSFTSTLSIDLGILLDPISVMMLIVISTVSLMVHTHFSDDANRDLHCLIDGTHLLFQLYERGTRFPTLLRIPQLIHHVNAGFGCCNEHIPNVPLLGVGRC